MSLSLWLLWVLLAAALGWLGWRRTCVVGLVLALLGFFAIGCGPVPRVLLARLQAPYAVPPPLLWAPSNAIVLLTGGAVRAPHAPVEPGRTAYGRIVQTAVLYHDCRSARVRCTVLVSGGDAGRVGRPLSDVYARTLGQLGVPEGDMVLERRSMDTWQNAVYAAPLLRQIGAQRVWLVTSGFHMRRAMLDFAAAGIRPIAVRSDYLKVLGSWRPKASNFQLMDTALHEYAGVLAYHLYQWSGRNRHLTPSYHPLAHRTR